MTRRRRCRLRASNVWRCCVRPMSWSFTPHGGWCTQPCPACHSILPLQQHGYACCPSWVRIVLPAGCHVSIMACCVAALLFKPPVVPAPSPPCCLC